MQVKQINTPLHTPLVTLLMHTLQAHARACTRAVVWYYVVRPPQVTWRVAPAHGSLGPEAYWTGAAVSAGTGKSKWGSPGSYVKCPTMIMTLMRVTQSHFVEQAN
jgi:hypothetical protein